MVNVCDHCRKEVVVEKITIKGKYYDLCSNCLHKIINYLETPESSNPLANLGKMFKG